MAIDLGSNTLRVLEYDCKNDRPTAEYEKIVKTADRLEQTGVISHDAQERIICAIKEAKEQIDFDHQAIKAVTTEALRKAKNSREVLWHIAQKTGVIFEIIDGQEEARLTLLAAMKRLMRLRFDTHSFVLVDIGGGSTELTFVCKKGVLSRSFPIGIVTIAQKYKKLKMIEDALDEEMRHVERFIEEAYEACGNVASFVATAGTPTTVAALYLGMDYEHYDASKINGTILDKEVLNQTLKQLLSMPVQQRERLVGTGRADLITAGIMIYAKLYDLLKFKQSIVIDDGLREGVALDYCQKNLHNIS